MTDRLDRLERHLDEVLAGPRRLMRSLGKHTTGTAMIPNHETSRETTLDALNWAAMKVRARFGPSAETAARMIESALTKAEAVEPVAQLRGYIPDEGPLFLSFEWDRLKELPAGTTLYAHAPPAVPVESLGRDADERDPSVFEQWYIENAPDYENNLIGTRQCWLMRKAWNAACYAHASKPAEPPASVPDGPARWFPLLGTPFAIRRSMLNEEQARKNHAQSLDVLASRGGLSPSEAWANASMDRVSKNQTQRAAFECLLAAHPLPTNQEGAAP